MMIFCHNLCHEFDPHSVTKVLVDLLNTTLHLVSHDQKQPDAKAAKKNLSLEQYLDVK